MTIREFKKLLHEKLLDIYPLEELNSFIHLLLGHYLDFSRVDISLNLENEIPIEHRMPLKSAIKKLQMQMPIQYILGYTEFMGLNLKVSSGVLIPRPETEELVRMIIEDYKNTKERLSIMDIGTGSGCIALSLAKYMPNAAVMGIDISEEALNVANENAKSNKVQLSLEQCDILNLKDSDFQNMDLLDIIVSNPPYVRKTEKQMMKKNVLDFEPHLALFVEDDDPLLFYRKIADFALKKLKDQGILYFEINEYLSKDLKSLLSKKGFKSISLFKDIFGKDRMIKATKL